MALLANDGSIIRAAVSPRPPLIDHAIPRPELVKSLESIKRAHVESALILCGGDRSLAAKRLRVSRGALQRWIVKFRSEDLDDCSA